MFALCSTQYSAALRCAAGQITINPKDATTPAAFLSMLADFVCSLLLLFAVAVDLYVLGIAFFTVFVLVTLLVWRQIRPCIANLGENCTVHV